MHPPRLCDLVGVGRADDAQPGHRPQRRELLDRLVRGAVFAEADGVVRPDERDLVAGERGEPYGTAHVVAEHEERAAERQEAARGHPVHDGAHPVFADAEVELAPLELMRVDLLGALQLRPGVAGEVGAAAHEGRYDVGDGIEHC